MYVFKILRKTLAQEPLEVKNNSAKKLSSPKKTEGSRNNANKKNAPNFSSKAKAKNIAYCLFANSGESILAFYNDEKVTIFLNEISHPNKNSPTSKLSNDFINQKIKKKSIFLEITEEKENGDLVANIFLDPKQEQCLNTMLKDEDLASSNAMVTDENEHHYSNSFSDMKIIHEEKKDISTPIEKSNNNSKNLDYLTGTLKNWGWAPFLNKPSNSKSFFITLEKDDAEETKWGIDLERALTFSKANRGDYIEINKEKSENKTTYSSNGQAKTSQKNTWIIKKLNTSNTEELLYSDSTNTIDKDNSPLSTTNSNESFLNIEDSFHDSSFNDTNESEAIPSWVSNNDNEFDKSFDDFMDNQPPLSLDDIEINTPNIDVKSEEHFIPIETKYDNKNELTQSTSYDLMDDILSSLDDNEKNLDKKRNLKI